LENNKLIGRIRHYFQKIDVAIVDLTDDLACGEEILISGTTTHFKQKVDSMQIEHENVNFAKAGHSIGLKVKSRVKDNDMVYKV
jgi:hypothetical protein